MPATVPTTLGEVPVAALGRVDAHEHIIIDGGYTTVADPSLRLDDVEKAGRELALWRAAGGGAVIDAMPFGCGRQIDKLVAASRAAEVPIVVATGFQKNAFYLPDHWQHRYGVEEIASLLSAECIEGVDRNNLDGPLIARSEVRAGFIKLAGDYHAVADTTRRLIRAAGLAHAESGAPVLVHTEFGTAAHELLDLLEEAGVPPSRVLLCHLDRNPDPRLHVGLAERGAFLEYDTQGRIRTQPESVILGLLRHMIAAGHEDRLTLGGDLARRSYWRAYGGGPGLDYLLTTFARRMLDEGIGEQSLNSIMCTNPARWLAG